MAGESIQRELGSITAEIKNLYKSFEDNTDSQNIILNEIKTKLDYTNGKVRNHDFWIKAVKWGSGIVGSILLIASPILIDYLSDKIAASVEKSIDEKLEGEIKNVLQTFDYEKYETR